MFGYLNHAVSLYESHYASREDIDAAMKLGCGLPMGPLALLDLIGTDTAYEILDTMYKQGRDRLHAPCPLFKQMITAGWLGRKSGRGFYTYDAPDSPNVVADERTPGATAAVEGARPVSRVGVVGSGTMATGIVEVFAKAGYDVTFVARSPEKASSVLAAITRSLEKAVQRGKLAEPGRDDALARISSTSSLDELADAQLVVEAVVEDLAVKQALFSNLEDICPPGTVLATTTSSLPVIECAAATSRPGRRHRDALLQPRLDHAAGRGRTHRLHRARRRRRPFSTWHAKIGKHAVRCGDRAGFIVNALLFPYLNDAVKMLEAHYASADDIDAAMKVGCGYPMGPFELLDVVGNDVSLAIQRELYLEFREPGFAPAPLLEHLVTAGRLGRKTGKGFRDYT